MKRHASLIPLSHDHHLGLVLAQRIRRGRSKNPRSQWPTDPVAQRNRSLWLYESLLRPHFRAEEEVVFPLARRYLGDRKELVRALFRQHVELERWVEEMRTAEAGELKRPMLQFAQLLERHIRREERVLFESIQELVPPEELDRCGRQILEHFQKSGKLSPEQCLF